MVRDGIGEDAVQLDLEDLAEVRDGNGVILEEGNGAALGVLPRADESVFVADTSGEAKGYECCEDEYDHDLFHVVLSSCGGLSGFRLFELTDFVCVRGSLFKP